MFFSIGCAALAMRVTIRKCCEFLRLARSEEAKWSNDHERPSDEVEARKGAAFSGLHCLALRVQTSKRYDSLIFCDAIAGARRVDTSFLENCIEKNFHVPNMRAGPW
jgi:hypothetical protein